MDGNDGEKMDCRGHEANNDKILTFDREKMVEAQGSIDRLIEMLLSSNVLIRGLLMLVKMRPVFFPCGLRVHDDSLRFRA